MSRHVEKGDSVVVDHDGRAYRVRYERGRVDAICRVDHRWRDCWPAIKPDRQLGRKIIAKAEAIRAERVRA